MSVGCQGCPTGTPRTYSALHRENPSLPPTGAGFCRVNRACRDGMAVKKGDCRNQALHDGGALRTASHHCQALSFAATGSERNQHRQIATSIRSLFSE